MLNLVRRASLEEVMFVRRSVTREVKFCEMLFPKRDWSKEYEFMDEGPPREQIALGSRTLFASVYVVPFSSTATMRVRPGVDGSAPRLPYLPNQLQKR